MAIGWTGDWKLNVEEGGVLQRTFHSYGGDISAEIRTEIKGTDVYYVPVIDGGVCGRHVERKDAKQTVDAMVGIMHLL